MIKLEALKPAIQIPEELYGSIQDEIKPKGPNLYMTDIGRYRYYYTKRGSTYKFYLSASSVCKLMPKNDFFLKWVASNGYEESQEFAHQRAEYGTLMHEINISYFKYPDRDMGEFAEIAYARIKNTGLPMKLHSKWTSDLVKDYISWAEFCFIHKVKPIAIEYPIYSSKIGLAGRIDFIGSLEVKERGFHGEVYKRNSGDNKAGDPKLSSAYVPYNVILDLKSGRKGFYDDHKLQLAAYKAMWNEKQGGKFPVTKVFNWAPKDWQSKSSDVKFSLKDQTDVMFDNLLKKYVEIARIRGLDRPSMSKNIMLLKDNVRFEEDCTESYDQIDLEEYLNYVHSSTGKKLKKARLLQMED